MNKKLKIAGIIASSIVFVMLVALIGVSIVGIAQRNVDYNSVAGSSMETEMEMEDGDIITDSVDNGGTMKASGGDRENFTSQQDKDQKLIYSGSANIGTNNIDKTYNELTGKMDEFKAKFDSVNENANSKRMVIRVPKDNFMKFYDSLDDISGDVVSSNLNVEDATKQYKDNERRLDTLQTEYDELKELMKKAKNIDDVLAIKDRLAELTYEMEDLKQSNNDIDYDADYSRMEITITKNGASIVPEDKFTNKIQSAFHSSIKFLQSFILGLIAIWWVLLIIAVIIIVIRKRIIRKKLNSTKTVNGE